MAALTSEQVDALKDEQFAVDCRAVHHDDCAGYGDLEDVCSGCPAWEALKARAAAKLTAGEAPAVLTRRAGP